MLIELIRAPMLNLHDSAHRIRSKLPDGEVSRAQAHHAPRHIHALRCLTTGSSHYIQYKIGRTIKVSPNVSVVRGKIHG